MDGRGGAHLLPTIFVRGQREDLREAFAEWVALGWSDDLGEPWG